MTPLWTSEDARHATGGETSKDWSATGVSINTRTLKKGDLFVALEDVGDGHDFVAEALEKGAAAALVSKHANNLPQNAPLLIVDDVRKALDDLGQAARARMSGQLIAVTGSVGKSCTIDMLKTALAPQGKTHTTEHNSNTQWGVSLTLARMPQDTEFAILELGMNHPGEIGSLSKFVRPHVAMITTIADVYGEAFKSVRQISKAKAEIFDGLEEGGHAVLNRDIATYAILSRAAKRKDATEHRYGYAGRPEFAIKRIRTMSDGSIVTYRKNGKKYHLKLSTPGAHLAQNGLGVLAAVHAAGGDIAEASLALAGWTPPAGRGARLTVDLGEPEVDGSITLIDESNHANPTSMEAALDGLALSEPKDGIGRVSKGRRIAILGDMLELGPDEIKSHSGLAHLKAINSIDKIHTVGGLMSALHQSLPEPKRGRHFATKDALKAEIDHLLDAGDVVLIKASQDVDLAQAVDAVKAMGQIRDTNEKPTQTGT